MDVFMKQSVCCFSLPCCKMLCFVLCLPSSSPYPHASDEQTLQSWGVDNEGSLMYSDLSQSDQVTNSALPKVKLNSMTVNKKLVRRVSLVHIRIKEASSG